MWILKNFPQMRTKKVLTSFKFIGEILDNATLIKNDKFHGEQTQNGPKKKGAQPISYYTSIEIEKNILLVAIGVYLMLKCIVGLYHGSSLLDSSKEDGKILNFCVQHPT